MSNKIFVYGTLKKGFENSYVLGDSILLGAFITADPLYGILTSNVPYMFRKENGHFVKGESYIVSNKTLSKLDIFEKNGLEYNRELIKIKDLNEQAWCYLCTHKFLKENKTFREIQSDDSNTLTW